MEYIVETTLDFDKWLRALKDISAKAHIIRRLERIEAGNFGDCKTVGDGVSELRIHVGAGYRAYYTIRGNIVVLMLTGGDKSTQNKDIAKAKQLKKDLI